MSGPRWSVCRRLQLLHVSCSVLSLSSPYVLCNISHTLVQTMLHVLSYFKKLVVCLYVIHFTHTGTDNATCIILLYKVSCLSADCSFYTSVLQCPAIIIISSIRTLEHITIPDNAMCIILLLKVSFLSVCMMIVSPSAMPPSVIFHLSVCYKYQ